MPAFAPREVFDPRLTIARNTPGGRFNSAGMYEMVAVNTPRFDYDPRTVSSRNLYLYSEFQNGLTGVNRSSTVIAIGDFSTFPGFDSGLEYTPLNQQDYAVRAPILQPNTVYTFSIFVKMDNGLAPNMPGNGASTANDFSLALANGYGGAYTVENYGYGVYRVSCTFTTPATIGNTATGVYTQAGGPMKKFRTTGWQINKGPLAGDYIPTLDLIAGNAMARGLLVEDAKVNIFLQSGNLTVAPWGGSGGTALVKSVDNSGPGGLPATTFTAGAADPFWRQGVTATSTSHTVSCYVKKIGTDNNTKLFALQNNTTGVTFTGGIWNPANGTISGAGWTSEEFEDGWYLLTFTQGSGITAGDLLYFYTGLGGTGGNLPHTYKVSAPQLETGITRTSYIPTTTAAVTRLGDNISVPAATLKYQKVQGTIFFDGVQPTYGLGYARIGIQMGSGGTMRHLMYLLFGTLNGYSQGDTGAFIQGLTIPGAGSRIKGALSWDSTGFWVSVNGGDAVFKSAPLFAGNEDKLWIGSLGSGDYWNSVMGAVEYYPRTLSPAQLKAMTTL